MAVARIVLGNPNVRRGIDQGGIVVTTMRAT